MESITFSSVKTRFINVMTKHKGEKNSISPRELFIKMYGVKPEDLHIEDILYHKRRLYSAIKALRKEFYFEIVSIGYGEQAKLFIPVNKEDLTSYKTHIEDKREALKNRYKEVERFVKSKQFKHFGKPKQIT